MKAIYFYSNTHLGDLHIGRSYVRWFVDNFDAKFYYTHNYSSSVLSDIDKLEYLPGVWERLPMSGGVTEDEHNIYLNTWIGADGTAMGVNFKAIHFIFTKYFNFLIEKGYKCNKNNLEQLMPKINFDSNNISKNEINAWFNNRKLNKKILICNNYVQSGQSINFHMNSLIEKLAEQFPDIEFYLTNQDLPIIENYQNIFYIDKIINKPPFNLNEVSYFSTFCDAIIGRGSGPFSFCEIEENINKLWISITFPHLEPDVFNGLNKFPNNGKYIHTMDTNSIFDLIFDFNKNN
jgi:hypothetical protein